MSPSTRNKLLHCFIRIKSKHTIQKHTWAQRQNMPNSNNNKNHTKITAMRLEKRSKQHSYGSYWNESHARRVFKCIDFILDTYFTVDNHTAAHFRRLRTQTNRRFTWLLTKCSTYQGAQRTQFAHKNLPCNLSTVRRRLWEPNRNTQYQSLTWRIQNCKPRIRFDLHFPLRP